MLLVSDSQWVIAEPLPSWMAMPQRTRWQRARRSNARFKWLIDNPDVVMYQAVSILDRVERLDARLNLPEWTHPIG